MVELGLVWMSWVWCGCVWFGMGEFVLVLLSSVWYGLVWFGVTIQILFDTLREDDLDENNKISIK